MPSSPPIPKNEARRLAALHAYEVLDTAPEARFDRLTRLASMLTQSPIATVTLVDSDRQWFKSKIGLESAETPREESFCAHAIAGEGTMIVEDAAADPRFSANPSVTGAPFIRFYAGVPLKTPSGHQIGTLCIADKAPRQLTPEQLRVLEDLAAMASDELELCQAVNKLNHRRSYLEAIRAELVEVNGRLKQAAATDGLTGLANRRAFDKDLSQEWRRAMRKSVPLSLVLFDVDHFKLYNDRYGHPMGDKCLKAVADALQKSLRRPGDLAARYGGEEFAAVLPDTGAESARMIAEAIRADVAALRLPHAASAFGHVTISVGVATAYPSESQGQSELLLETDHALYRAKAGGRNRIAIAEIAVQSADMCASPLAKSA